MTQRTPLHATHVAAGARMVDFAGWDMPVNYGSQIEEHHAVRRDAGMFDVSHMLALDLVGSGAKAFLRGLIANDVAKLTEPGKALYSCMLNPEGGVIVRKNGALTGEFQERAMRLVRDVMPAPDQARMVDAIGAACDHLASLGFASAAKLAALTPAHTACTTARRCASRDAGCGTCRSRPRPFVAMAGPHPGRPDSS